MLTRLISAISFAATLISSCSSVEAVKVPNGKYYDTVGFQDAYVEVVDSSIVAGTCGGRGCPDFSKFKIVASDEAMSSILVQTPWGQKVSYCVKTTDLEDSLNDLQKIASSRAVFASCDSSLGWLYSYEMNTQCELDSMMLPCNVGVEKKKVLIGGYQAAPVYELTSKSNAADTLDRKFNVIHTQKYVEFVPVNGDSNSLRVYNLNL
ncbi:hypothetical protein [Vulcanococcus limneticus]|uniref:hypothetical protein n=1 Tax=Vulcanococcus limneticus TaxID=2170428 RepID=UPI00398BF9D3